MRAIADNGVTHHYIYDAAGERVIKSHGDGQAIYVNGFPMNGSGTVGNYTMYVNPFMVVQNSKYTKHFYIEGQRIVSKLGAMGIKQPLLHPKSNAGDSLKIPVNWNTKKEKSKEIIIANFEALGLDGAIFTAGKSGKVPYGQMKKYFKGNDVVINPGGGGSTGSTSNKTEDLQFYYHPDHLGSSNYITDVSGEVYQHHEYFPFGETFIEERNAAEYTHYLYNGKELDEETGLYYYGARYYDSRTSMFLGVDPDTETYNDWTPYLYGANNPIRFEDIEGKGPGDKVLGFLASVVDNSLFGVSGAREALSSFVSDPSDYNQGQNVGDAFSLFVGAIEANTGAGIVSSSVAVTGGTGGLSIEVTGPTFVIGSAMALEGSARVLAASSSLLTQKGRVNETKVYDTRKEAKDARPKPKPAQQGQKRVTNQTRNKSGEGNKMKTDGGKQTPHFHDKNHNNKNKPNTHYRSTIKIKPNS